jgi:hypothetical protein
VCVLLGEVGSCSVAGAFSLGSVLGHNGVAYSLGSGSCTTMGRPFLYVAFSLGSVLGLLLGNDIYIRSSVFFGVCSGAVAWQRQ